jgi:hypothetical protein
MSSYVQTFDGYCVCICVYVNVFKKNDGYVAFILLLTFEQGSDCVKNKNEREA